MCDFEKGIQNSIKKNFPKMKIKGCHFHFAQSIVKHLNKNGLKGKCNKNEQFKNAIRNLIDGY